jgi:hypothetical protein
MLKATLRYGLEEIFSRQCQTKLHQEKPSQTNSKHDQEINSDRRTPRKFLTALLRPYIPYMHAREMNSKYAVEKDVEERKG